MSRIVIQLYLFGSNNCTYLAVYDGGGMNLLNCVTYDQKYTNDKIIMKI